MNCFHVYQTWFTGSFHYNYSLWRCTSKRNVRQRSVNTFFAGCVVFFVCAPMARSCWLKRKSNDQMNKCIMWYHAVFIESLRNTPTQTQKPQANLFRNLNETSHPLCAATLTGWDWRTGAINLTPFLDYMINHLVFEMLETIEKAELKRTIYIIVMCKTFTIAPQTNQHTVRMKLQKTLRQLYLLFSYC